MQKQNIQKTNDIHNFYRNFRWEKYSCWKIIVIKDCLSYMQCDFWVYNWQGKSIKQFQHSLSIHENYTFYTFYTSTFFTSSPWLLKPDTNLFCQRRFEFQHLNIWMYTKCNNMPYCFRYEIFLFKKYLGLNQFMISVNSFFPLQHFIQI